MSLTNAYQLPVSRHPRHRGGQMADDAPSALGYRLSLHSDPGELVEPWCTLEQSAQATFYQTHGWASHWQYYFGIRSGHQPAIVIGRDADGSPAFLLAFAITRLGPFRILKWLGDSSSHYGMGLFTRRAAGAIDSSDFAEFWRGVLGCLPRVDIVALRNLPSRWRDTPNPLRRLATSQSIDEGYLIHLEHDFDALYARKRSGATRTRTRRIDKHLRKSGDIGFAEVGAGDRARFTATLSDYKNRQLRDAGAPEMFNAQTRAFFIEQLGSSSSGRVRAHALTRDGQTIAGTITARHQNCLHGIIMSMQPGPAQKHSPGDYALRRLIAEACEANLELMDLGVGTAAYKAAWADETIAMSDAIMASRARALPLALCMKATMGAKRAIKHSSLMWRLFKMARRTRGLWNKRP